MARIARVVIPGLPHHITQRGNRRQRVFFNSGDFLAYKGLLQEWCAHSGVAVWAYCFMTNHVHLILVPKHEDSLRLALGEAHRRYTRRINLRYGWRGHLWQERFASYVMDETHLLAAARYVELNPVRARIVSDPGAYPWSSAAAHLRDEEDTLLKDQSLRALVPEWQGFLEGGLTETEQRCLEKHSRTGRPMGSDTFIATLETRLGRYFRLNKPGRKARLPVQN